MSGLLTLGILQQGTGHVLNLDAGDIRSYPGTGTIWYDIGGNKHHATTAPSRAAPSFSSLNGGRFDFTGGQAFIIQNNVGSYSECTHEIWINIQTNNAIYIADGRAGLGTYWHTNLSSININIGGTLRANNPATYKAASDWWYKWIHLVVTRDTSNTYLYINGELINDARLISSTSTNINIGSNFRIGERFTSTHANNFLRGYLGAYRIYDRVLSASDVLSQFNATKTRFGL